MTLYKFKDLLYDPKYPFGIYAGGPNEQGYNMSRLTITLINTVIGTM